MDEVNSKELEIFMQQNSINVIKKIPAFAGLGGGSSDAATFLKMCNEELNLGLSVEKLAEIGMKVGADVAFFIYGYDSANVSGIGEIVEEFKEDLLDIKTYTPHIEISTPLIYKSYRKNFFNPISEDEALELSQKKSKDILLSTTPEYANDLFQVALSEYDELKKYKKDGYFFSGSGSSFFTSK